MVTCPKTERQAAGWGITRPSAILERMPANDFVPTQIHPSAVLGENVDIGVGTRIMANVVIENDVVIGKDVVIYPGCYIGENTVIGDRAVVRPSVVIREFSVIGKNVYLDSGVIVGSDGFGFSPNKETGDLDKIPQVGTVVIEDNVRIGANVTLDRATLGKTVIGKGTFVGALSQIAHNVVIGEETNIGPQSGICGSTCIGSHVQLGQHTGVIGHIKVADFVVSQAGSGITKDVSAGADVAGMPAAPREKFQERKDLEARLPELFERVENLKALLNQ